MAASSQSRKPRAHIFNSTRKQGEPTNRTRSFKLSKPNPCDALPPKAHLLPVTYFLPKPTLPVTYFLQSLTHPPQSNFPIKAKPCHAKL